MCIYIYIYIYIHIYIYICIYIYIKWGTNAGNGHMNWDLEMVNHHRICRDETT